MHFILENYNVGGGFCYFKINQSIIYVDYTIDNNFYSIQFNVKTANSVMTLKYKPA